MKIIDKETGKRVIRETNKELKKTDPIKRNAEKGLEAVENSPMDPPEAYDETAKVDEITYDDMALALQQLMDEHRKAEEVVGEFESALASFKENRYQLTEEINASFGKFFEYFDNNILAHNEKEEKHLFPILEKKLIESGEKGTGEDARTAIDLMEDDHVKFIQLAALTFNMLGLATRLPDPQSQVFTFDVAYNNGRELVEMLKLHIFREDNTLFPLAQKLLSAEELEIVEKDQNK